MKIIITESQKKKLMNDFMKSLVDHTLDENEPSYLDSYIVIWDKTDVWREKVLDMIKNSFENKFNVDVKYIEAGS